MSDRLHEALDSLRSHTDRVSLATPAAIRRRGDHRQLRLRATTSAVVLTSIAALGGGALHLDALDHTPTQPAGPAPETATPGLSPSPTPGAGRPLDQRALLVVAELPPFGHNLWSVNQTVDPADEADIPEYMTVCGGSLTPGVEPRHAMLRDYIPAGAKAAMWEWVAEYPTEQDAVSTLRAFEARCGDEGWDKKSGWDEDSPERSPMESDFGAYAVYARYSEHTGDNIGVARHRNVVTVLALHGEFGPADIDSAEFAGSTIATGNRVSACSSSEGCGPGR